MLGLDTQLSQFQFTPIAALSILAASIAGSVHCVGMCGGLMLAATGTKLSAQFAYHLSRLIGYLSIGIFAGYLGHLILFQVFFSTVFVILLIAVAMSSILNWKINPTSIISKFGINLGLKFGNTNGSLIRASLVGFFTVFLPCGWLYSFVLLSMATHSVFYGGLVLSIFWLGTIPALMGSRIIIQGVMAKVGVKGTRLISFLMILVAIFSVYEHWKHNPIQSSIADPNHQLNCPTGK